MSSSLTSQTVPSFLKSSRTLEDNNNMINKHTSREYIGKSKYSDDESDQDLSKLHQKWKQLRKYEKLSKTREFNNRKRLINNQELRQRKGKILSDFIIQNSISSSSSSSSSEKVVMKTINHYETTTKTKYSHPCIKKDPEHNLLIEDQCIDFLKSLNTLKNVKRIINHWLNRNVLNKNYSPWQSISFIIFYVLYSPIDVSYFSNGLSLFGNPNYCMKLMDELSQTPSKLPSSLSSSNNISIDRFSIPHKFFNDSIHDIVNSYYEKGCFLQVKIDNSSGCGISRGKGGNGLSNMNLGDFVHNDLLDKHSSKLRFSLITQCIFRLNSESDTDRSIVTLLFNNIMSSIRYTTFFITNHYKSLLIRYRFNSTICNTYISNRINNAHMILDIIYEMIRKIMISGRLTSMLNVNKQCQELIKNGEMHYSDYNYCNLMDDDYHYRNSKRKINNDDDDNDQSSVIKKSKSYHYYINDNEKQKMSFIDKLELSISQISK